MEGLGCRVVLAAAVSWASMILPPGPAQSSVTYVAVSDKAGNPVGNVAATEVVVRVDDVVRPVLEVRRAVEQPWIVIIVDGYTASATLQVRRALQGILGVVRDEAPSAMVGLMVSEAPASPPFHDVSKDAPLLDRTVRNFVRATSSPPLLESIVVAAKALGASTTPRRLIFVMTSQDETGPAPYTAEVAGDFVRQSGASLWALQSSSSSRNEMGRSNELVLKSVTRASGGRRDQYFTWLIEKHAVSLARLMMSQYAVAFAAPLNPHPRYLRVGVTRKDVEVYAPGWMFSL